MRSPSPAPGEGFGGPRRWPPARWSWSLVQFNAFGCDHPTQPSPGDLRALRLPVPLSGVLPRGLCRWLQLVGAGAPCSSRRWQDGRGTRAHRLHQVPARGPKRRGQLALCAADMGFLPETRPPTDAKRALPRAASSPLRTRRPPHGVPVAYRGSVAQ